MKTYNRALDYVALAFAEHSEGRVQTAAELFAKAVTSPDMLYAVKVIEASNAQAHSARQAAKAQAVEAAAKAAKQEAAAALASRRQQMASILGDRLPAAEFASTEPEEAEDEAIEKEEKEVDATANAFAQALHAAVQK